ncbi:B3 domain-containing protein Os11g0197600-like isoform X5 [Amaranthus tricolor]|uniref:B3 domain-containing protein Os11g0197600-like isoform X5 n=1 Tax=Amaranthus tricolor TaxID=29722 RepID=UPI002582D623|nr:B3 domain-containing protein Os11g0197600-like isoform X5 [Amaranthus tricolor]
MDDKPEACAECSRFCLSLHKSKLDPLPIVSSFFKVMLGNHFSEVLIVPPRFAKTITELEGKSTYFEDSTGQKWEVYLTNNNGSLAFQKGWREFFVDHNIQLGDFLVFNYFKGSHFNVQIFDRSGCEKPMIFSKKDYQKNRAKTTKDYIPKSLCRVSSNKKFFANKCTNSFMDFEPDIDVMQRKDAIHKVRKFHEVEEDVPRQENTNKRPKVVPKDNVDADNMSITRGNMCFQTPNTMLKADTSKIITDDEADWLSTKCVALPNDAVSRAVMPLKVLYPGQSVAAPHTSEFTSPTSYKMNMKKRK